MVMLSQPTVGAAIPKTRCDLFWSHVDKTDVCWIWMPHSPGGGPLPFCLGDGRLIQPRRFAYQELVGPLEPGERLDMRCRNRRCVRPSHISLLGPNPAKPDPRDIADATVHGCHRLAAAILVHAAEESRGASLRAEDARRWLHGPDAAAWAELAGINPELLKRQPLSEAKVRAVRADAVRLEHQFSLVGNERGQGRKGRAD